MSIIKNGIIAGLPAADAARLAHCLEPVALKRGQAVEIAGRRPTHAYFPASGLISLFAEGKRRAPAEVGLVGREGMTGYHVVLGSPHAPFRSFVQVAGEAFRLTMDDLLQVSSDSSHLRSGLLLFAHRMSVQAGQTAVANAQGTIPERLARRLLMAHDRLAVDEIHLTHEMSAMMLGAPRPSVSLAYTALQRKGLLAQRRGVVSILDRTGLERFAGRLYRADR